MFRKTALAFLFCGSLAADQFAYIGEDLANRAVAILSREKEVYLLCEPCGEKSGEFRSYSKAEVRPVNIPAEINPESESYSEVYIDGQPLDLAYVYVRVNNKYKNLAILLGEQPSGVSAEIDPKSEMYHEETEESSPQK